MLTIVLIHPEPLTGPSFRYGCPGRVGVRSLPTAMALPDLDTAEGLEGAVGQLDPDFQGLLEKKQIPERTQGSLSNAGVRTVSRFSVIALVRLRQMFVHLRSINWDLIEVEMWSELQVWSMFGRPARQG